MEFFLTIFICSAIDNKCVIPNNEGYMYPKTYNTHFECVRSGLSDSYEILFAEKFFDKDSINQYKLYPKFTCDEVGIEGEPV